MGFVLFAIVLGIVSEIFWFLFYRNGKKNFIKYDKEHSNIAVLNAEEIAAKLNQNSNLRISNITLEENQISFVSKKNNYSISIENGIAFVDYDMSGCEVRLSSFGKLLKRIRFLKSAHKAIFINTIMDTIKNDNSADSKNYEKTKLFAKASIITLIAFVISLVIGCFSAIGSISSQAVDDARAIEFYNGVTCGELIDIYVTDADWSAFNGEGDMAVVEITGTSVEGEDICIQFWGNMGMGLSYRSLTLKFFEADGLSYDPTEFMEYIYLNYYINH